jgi:hypothetical protein
VCLGKMKQSRDRWKAQAIALEAAVANEGIGSPGGPARKPQPRRAATPGGVCPR